METGDRALGGSEPVAPDPASAELPRAGAQQEMPFAVVMGAPLLVLPQDLYIPPDALEVFLDAFEGPLDLLLYLIKRQNLDILDIPIAAITDQYMEYVDLMKELKLELAAEYLVMAAMLAEIKSRLLLPRPPDSGEDEEDPRAELIRRLQEYERFKLAAQGLDALPRLERDVFAVHAEIPPGHSNRIPPQVDLREVLIALRGVLARADLFASHRVEKESLSLRERMSLVLERVRGGAFVDFVALFDVTEGRAGVVVTFLALLELIKAATLELVQTEPFAPIHVRMRDPGSGVLAEEDHWDERERDGSPSLKTIVEGALFAAGGPLTLDQLQALFPEDERPERAELLGALGELIGDYEGRGVEIAQVAGGYRVQVRSAVAPWVARLWDEKPARYSRALLETLALIAYRQPITRGEIEDIRGVAVTTQIVKTLSEREWIRVVGHRDLPGRPALYATTRKFLDYFGLRSLNDLPPLAEIRDPAFLGDELDLGESDIPPPAAEPKPRLALVDPESEGSD